ncbi:MAG: glycoside hydrolase family 13 protein [Bacteroidetes bacterium]|nr:glycoside hydrolase family 13 protein [Bacteroidota bacterium]MBU1719969.1 glycoside hydrolase family 13 protein [Bacteroidota bacterium]
MKRLLLYLILLLGYLGANAQVIRVDPPCWWVGMNDSTVQLLVEGKNIANCKATLEYKGVVIKQARITENPDFLVLDLYISASTKPGMLRLSLSEGKKKHEYNWELKHRKPLNDRKYGLSPADVIYLLMPDRFANGDIGNDKVDEMNDSRVNRDSLLTRHGGDLQGIMNHLSYFSDLGVSALWLNPVFENDQPFESYHGYAFTDHYKVDPRLGTNELYKALIDSLHSRKMKMVKDIVFNHTGNKHHLFLKLPFTNWVHQHDTFTKTNYRATTLMDPYASDYDKNRMTDGWFDHHMPDLNQKDEILAKYLIQNSIWWIEFAGIDAYRVDTWAYPDQDFMEKWYLAVQNEYPGFTVFGETWVHGATVQSWFTGNRPDWQPKSSLPAVTDFQLYYAINEALTKPQGWTEGVSKIYYALAKDFHYEQPNQQVTFLDNHDLNRFFSIVGEDVRKLKSGIAFLLTTRGIPCLYYGTEIGMKGFTAPDALVRLDFPGGWPDDPRNAFEQKGRTIQENEIWNYVHDLLKWRSGNKAITTGKLKQFVPENGIYVYSRYTERESVVVFMNTSEKATEIGLSRYAEVLKGAKSGMEIPSNQSVDFLNSIVVPAFSTRIFEIREENK